MSPVRTVWNLIKSDLDVDFTNKFLTDESLQIRKDAIIKSGKSKLNCGIDFVLKKLVGR